MRRVDDQQLRFELELDEAAEDALQGSISYEEAQRRSLAARAAFEQGGRHAGMPVQGWASEYYRLIELGWPWRVACYIAWAASPKEGRWPETLKALAEEVLGLSSPRVIYTWRQKHPAIDQVVAMMQAAPLFEHRRDVLEALIEMARTPDYKAFNDRKLFLEMIGDYVPRSQIDVGRSAKGDEQDLSDDELRAMLGSGSTNLAKDRTDLREQISKEEGDDAGE